MSSFCSGVSALDDPGFNISPSSKSYFIKTGLPLTNDDTFLYVKGFAQMESLMSSDFIFSAFFSTELPVTNACA